jgi:fanconi anemia group D2 protein
MRVLNRGDYYGPDASSAVDATVVLLAEAGCTLLIPPHHLPVLASCLLEGLAAFAASSPRRLRQMLLPTALHMPSLAQALLSFLALHCSLEHS